MRLYGVIYVGLSLVVGLFNSTPSEAATRKAISKTPGAFLEIGGKFDGKPVACQRMRNGKFEAGYITTVSKKRYWNPTAPLIAKKSKQKRVAAALKNLVPKLNESCRRKAASYCKLSVNSATIRFNDLQPATFSLTITNSCNLPVTLEQVSAPTHGSLSGQASSLTYAPREVGNFVDQATVRVTTPVKNSANATLSFAGALSAACAPILTDSEVAVVENTEKEFIPLVTNRCNLPTTFTIIDSPAHGELRAEAANLVYVPDPHYLSADVARVRAQNVAGTSTVQAITFRFSPRANQFAGDKNVLSPYRDQLTQDEVDSLLKRVSMGGNESLRQIHSLSALVDALLTNTETTAVTDYLNNFDQTRFARITPSGSTNVRWQTEDVYRANIQALRYGQPFRTALAYNFWMNHFATDLYQQRNGGFSEAMMEHVQFIRENGTVSFETLFKGMMKRLLLHTYLNSYDNTSADPNENFAREALELFSAGIMDPISGAPNFNEDDVESATAIFAGMNSSTATAGYRPIAAPALATAKIIDASDDDPPVRTSEAVCTRKTANRIQVRWANSDRRGSDARILRAPVGSSTFQTIAEVNTWDGQFQDFIGYRAGDFAGATVDCPRTYPGAAPSPGVVYQYKVQFIQKDGNGAVVATGAESAIETGYFATPAGAPAAPANQTATTNLSDRIRLSWAASAGATSYRIFRTYFDANFDDHMIAEVPSGTTSYDDLSIRPNKQYLYYIRAVNSSTRLLSPHPVRFYAYTTTTFVNGLSVSPNAPKLPPVDFVRPSPDNANAITISWSAVPGAAGYRIFASPAWYEMYTMVADVMGGTSYTDTQTPPGQMMFYSVVPMDSSRRLSTLTAASTQLDEKYLKRTITRDAQGRVIGDDLLRPKRVFLDWLPDGDPNVGGRILGSGGDGDYYSVFGQNVYEKIAGRYVSAPTRSFLDHLLFAWPATSRNIAAKLFASLVHREINEELVGQVAQKLQTDQMNLRDLLRMLLMSSASFSPEANGTCVMNPSEVIMTFLRITDLPLTKPQSFDTVYTALDTIGHDVGEPPSVFGFKNCGLVRGGLTHDGSNWLASSQTYVALGNGISAILKQLTNPVGSNGEGINLMTTFVPAAGQIAADGVVDSVAAKLRITLSAGERTALIDYLNRSANGQVDTWRRALSAADQTARLAGLLRMMVMSPEFLSK